MTLVKGRRYIIKRLNDSGHKDYYAPIIEGKTLVYVDIDTWSMLDADWPEAVRMAAEAGRNWEQNRLYLPNCIVEECDTKEPYYFT